MIVPASPLAFGVGAFFAPDGEPNLAGFNGATGELDARMPLTAETRAIFCAPHNDPAFIADVARREGLPWLYYIDRHGLTPEMVPPGARAAVYAYPTIDFSAAWTAAIVRAELEALTAAGIGCDVVLSLYRSQQGDRFRWTEAHVLEVAEAIWPLVVQHAGAVWCFAKRRPNDGIDHVPAFADAFEQLKAASGDWRAFPTVAAAPQPEPVPSPTPAPTTAPVPVPSPEPPSPFPAVTPYEGSTMNQRGYLLGPGGMYARVDPSEPGVVHFDRLTPGAHEEVEITKPDSKYAVRFVSADVLVNFRPKWSCDGVDLQRQFETRPLDKRGADESPNLYVTPDGQILALVVHVFDGRRFASAPLTFVEKA